jgi:hypothetical protein
MPHNPKPPTEIVEPSAMSATASAADETTLSMLRTLVTRPCRAIVTCVTRRLGTFASLVLGLVAALVLVPAAPSSAAATMSVVSRDSNQEPQLLSTSSGRLTDVDVVTDGPAANVVVTFSGTGLSIDTPVVNLGTVNGSERATVEVTATTPGFHTLEIGVTSSDSGSVGTTLPLMWAPGTSAPGGDSLAGRNYGDVDLYEFAGNSYEDRQLLSFLDDDLAFIGNPAKGRPTCTSGSETARSGCVAYHYDKSTGIVQIGGAIGIRQGKAVHVEGIGRSDDSGGETYNLRDFVQLVSYPAPGKKFGLTWKWTYDNFPDGLTSVKLTLRKNGTFVLAAATDNKKPKVKHGSYALTAPGRLRLKGKFGVELHTFAVRSVAGVATPQKGAWLTFGTGKNADVVPLTRVP